MLTLVSIEEVTTTTPTTTQLIVTTTMRRIAIRTTLLGPHSNTNFRLCILRNAYSKCISIKEIYSILKFNLGKNVSVKGILVELRIYAFYAIYEEMRKEMNEVFLIGRLLEDVEYRFVIEKRKKCKSLFKNKTIRWNRNCSSSLWCICWFLPSRVKAKWYDNSKWQN